MFLPILSWFLLLSLTYSSTWSSVSFLSSAMSDHALDLSSALVCLLFLLSNAQPGLPGHAWIQCSFCSGFGCATVAQCPRSQAWVQPCCKDRNNLVKQSTSTIGWGSQPSMCFLSSIWQPQTVIPPSSQLPLPWRWWCRSFMHWGFGVFPDLALSIPGYLSSMRTSAVSREKLPAPTFISQMSSKDDHWVNYWHLELAAEGWQPH